MIYGESVDVDQQLDLPVDSVLGIEVRSIDRIPAAERHGQIRDQFTFWFPNNANIFVVVLGGVLVFMGLDFLWACVAIILGVVIGLVFVGFHAIQGPRLGVPQMIQSRAQFGFYGAVFVFAASIVLNVGFIAAQLVIQAQALNLLISAVGIPAWIAILSVPVVVITIHGYDWIHVFQRWMTWILAVTFVIISVQAILHDRPAGSTLHSGTPSFALLMEATGLFVIGVMSWAPFVSDYSRYLPENVSSVKTFWAVVLGCGIPFIVCAILGVYITGLIPHEESTVAAVSDIAGTWVLPVMAASLIGANVTNAYTGMLALASIVSCFTTVRRSVWMRVIGSLILIVAGTVCAILGYREFVGNLSNFLNVLLYVFVPWSAINLTDYYFVKRGHYDTDSFFTAKGQYGGFLWPGLVAYILAVAAQLPFIDQVFYTGPLVKVLGGVDISWVVGAAAGIAFYLIAVRLPQSSGNARGGSDPAAAAQPASR